MFCVLLLWGMVLHLLPPFLFRTIVRVTFNNLREIQRTFGLSFRVVLVGVSHFPFFALVVLYVFTQCRV